ncbi:MAG TPA: cytochrome c3 family protein [Armatimonadota bacterium]
MTTSGKTSRAVRSAILGVGLFLASVTPIRAQAAPRGAGAPAVAKPPTPPAPAAPAYVGSGACKNCHAAAVDAWSKSAHGKSLTKDGLPAELNACEACHGPAGAHVASPGTRKLRVINADDPKAANAVCGTCHFKNEASKAPAEWQNIPGRYFAGSQHGRKNLACVSCHTGHPNGNDKQLIKPAPQLCLGCHAKVLESSPGKTAAYTHSPVAKGQCLTCHDPHGTPDHNMVIPDVQQKCIQCHDPKTPAILTAHQGYPIAESKCAQCHDPHSHNQKASLVKTKAHMPFKQGKCEICHTKPVTGQPIGLVKPANELCMTCHPASVITPAGEHAHVPAKEGLCTTCHDPHVSNQKALMKARPAYTCFTCHSKIETDTVAEHRHKVLDTDLDCMMCHKPHSSPQPKLLVDDEISMCGKCHKHSFSHPIGKKADGTIVLNPINGDPMTCSSCHDIHGSKFEAMTIADKSRDLCILCHTGVAS